MTGGTGSYLYMAEEVCRHEPYNAKADVYSFAMILYEMASGFCPYQGMDPVEAATSAATNGLRPVFPLQPPAHFTEEELAVLPDVQRLISRCWARQPSFRCAVNALHLSGACTSSVASTAAQSMQLCGSRLAGTQRCVMNVTHV